MNHNELREEFLAKRRDVEFVSNYQASGQIEWERIADWWLSKLSLTTEKIRGEERERIRRLFVAECEKNKKKYGGAFVDYSFEHQALSNLERELKAKDIKG